MHFSPIASHCIWLRGKNESNLAVETILPLVSRMAASVAQTSDAMDVDSGAAAHQGVKAYYETKLEPLEVQPCRRVAAVLRLTPPVFQGGGG